MKKYLNFLLIFSCLYIGQACSDDDSNEGPEPLPENGKKGKFSLALTERIVQGYSDEGVVSREGYTGAYWNSVDSVDLYLIAGGQTVEEKGHRLYLQEDGTLLSDTMTLNTGAYTLSKLVLFDHWNSKVLEFVPGSDNTFVVEENSLAQKSYKIKNKGIYSTSRDSLALAALMKANFGTDPSKWPMDLTKAPSAWPYVSYSSTLGRIVSLEFSTYQDQRRTEDLGVVDGWGKTDLTLKVIPEELVLMDALQDIDFSGNEIEEIPTFIKNMKSVYLVKLDGNKLKSVPAELFQMLRLLSVILDNNPLETLPALRSASSVSTLSLVNCKLTSLGTELTNYKNLEVLDVRHNQIAQVGNLSSLSNLTYLDLSHNKLTALTNEMLPASLLGFYATDNQIASVPSNWSTPLLCMLNLSRNKLSSLPDNFFNFPALFDLYLSENNLNSLPAIGALENLLIVDFSDNQLTSLPADLDKCEKLRTLYLMNNPSLNWTLPEKMVGRYCTCLTELRDVEGNLTGELGGNSEGLFVKCTGSPSVKGVPTPPKCEIEEGEDGGF